MPYKLRAAMERLIWRAKGERYDKKDVWPNMPSFPVRLPPFFGPAADSWRQKHEYSGRRPGDPAWNASRFAVFADGRASGQCVGAGIGKQLSAVSAEMSKLNPDRNAVASPATAAAPIAQRFADRLAGMQYDSALALRAMQRITDDADAISAADERAAEQAAMALDSLYIAYSKKQSPRMPPEFAPHQRPVPNTRTASNYNADQFATALRRFTNCFASFLFGGNQHRILFFAPCR